MPKVKKNSQRFAKQPVKKKKKVKTVQQKEHRQRVQSEYYN